MITTSTPVGTKVSHGSYGQGTTTSKVNQDGMIKVSFADANLFSPHKIVWAYQLRIVESLPSAWMLRTNDLDSLADWFKIHSA